MKLGNQYRKLFQFQLTYPLLLVLAAIAVYFPILGNDFLYFWDDQWVVINHYTEGGFNVKNLWFVFTQFYHGQYAPLNELLYLVLYSLFGYNPFFFHLSSLLLHAANAVLTFLCFRELLKMSTIIGTKRYAEIAFFTALLFAVHPLNVESVAWMSASKVLVYAFYYLAATYSFLIYIRKEKLKYLIFTAILFACSFLGKEQAVTFPLWMLLIYWAAGHSLRDKKVWITAAPFFVLSLVFGIITMLSQSAANAGVLSGQASYPLWQRVVFACYTFAEYLFKLLFPFKLSYLYPFPSAIGDPLPQWLLVYPLLLALIAVALGKIIWKNKIVLFCLLFFAVHIAVALHIIPLSRFAIVADRYVYIASAGVCLALSCGFFYVFDKCKQRGKILISTLLDCIILYFGVYSNLRSRVWHDTDTLKQEIRELLKQRENYKESEELKTKSEE